MTESTEVQTTEPTTPVVEPEQTAPEAPTDPTGEEVIPAVPEVLVNAKRGAARAILRTVTAIRDGMVESWDTIRAYRLGGAVIDAKLEASETDAAIDYKDAVEQSVALIEATEKEYEESIKPFVAARDAKLAEISAKVKTYKDAAIEAEGLDGDIPSKSDAEDAANDWKLFTLQMRQTQTSAKRSNVEFEFAVPNLKTGSTAGSGDFRPRYSACSISKNGGQAVASKSLLVGDIAKEIGVARPSFIKAMLVPLRDDRENWDKEDEGYELEFTVGPINPDKDGNGDMYTLNVVKAPPIGAKTAE
jgi:hypothetical protein